MFWFFVRILLFSVLFETGFGFGQSRVNQGNKIGIEDAPYMARVRIKISAKKGGACDGTILDKNCILTAGHCVTDESNMNVDNPPLHGPSNFSILVGTGDLNDESKGEVYGVSKVFFKEFSSKNDMAILRLSTPIKLNGVTKKPVVLPTNPDYKPANRTEAYVDGWGTNPQKTEKLLRANVYTISVEECTTGADAGRDRSHQICTLGNMGAGPCQGDSGGPLLRADDEVQIGLVSLVPSNCANPGNTISTFTAIAPNLKWIQSTMLDDEDEEAEEDCDDAQEAEAKQDADEDCDEAQETEAKQDADEDCDEAQEAEAKQDADEDCDEAQEAEAKQDADEDCDEEQEAEAKQDADEDCDEAQEAEAKQDADEDCDEAQDDDDYDTQDADEDCDKTQQSPI